MDVKVWSKSHLIRKLHCTVNVLLLETQLVHKLLCLVGHDGVAG